MKIKMFVSLTTIIVFLFVGLNQFLKAQVLEQDSLALVALYDSTDGTNWTNNENWLTTNPVSLWHGVIVENDRVTKLLLGNNNLVGVIPPNFGDLTEMGELNLERNDISGPFPPEILKLTELSYLNLRSNNFSGPIPSGIESLLNLERLYLYINPFSGTIPKEIENLNNLATIRISFTEIEGPIPPELGNLSNLTHLTLANNHLLDGSIPPELGNLTKLESLDLTANNLSGNIPPELGNLSSLNDRFFLGKNELTGQIPSELGNLVNVKFFYLNGNNLEGAIPTELGNLVNLEYLFLDDNQLTGEIPSEISNLSKLEHLFLYRNQLSGPIPSEIGNLTNLIRLYLSENELSGEIPVAIGNLTNLEQIYFQNNNLTGQLPNEITLLTNLERLYLDRNQLEGAVPNEMVNLTKLKDIQLFDNHLIDLPDMSSLPLLEELEIQENKFTFEDIEPNIDTFYCSYSPQDSVGISMDTTMAIGESITLSVTVGGSANLYQWTMDRADIPGATESEYTIDSAEASDAGSYICKITNTIATELTLYSREMNVAVEGAVGVEKTENALPTKFALYQNYPNPFNPSTIIKYSIPHSSVISNPQRGERSLNQNSSEIPHTSTGSVTVWDDKVNVTLKVYDILGRAVATLVNQKQSPGNYEIEWNGSSASGRQAPSGVYFYQLTAGASTGSATNYEETKKMILLK